MEENFLLLFRREHSLESSVDFMKVIYHQKIVEIVFECNRLILIEVCMQSCQVLKKKIMYPHQYSFDTQTVNTHYTKFSWNWGIFLYGSCIALRRYTFAMVYVHIISIWASFNNIMQCDLVRVLHATYGCNSDMIWFVLYSIINIR